MRNNQTTCPRVGDNLAKAKLIPRDVVCRMADNQRRGLRTLSLEEGFDSYQLVGEVTAHQGEDG